nr:condensation domain-containing protein [uncultured bacterium]
MTSVERPGKPSGAERDKLVERLLERRGLRRPGARTIGRRSTDGPAPLSSAQLRLWFIDRLDPGNPAYNIGGALRLHGPLDADGFERAIRLVVARHEILRTTFAEVDGAPVQVVGDADRVSLDQLDLTGAAGPGDPALIRRHVEAVVGRPFSLDEGPLVRAALLRVGENEHVLALAMHHIVSDGWSMGILFAEVARAYKAGRRGEPLALDPLPLQYSDFAAWERDELTPARLDPVLEWWRERLAGVPELLDLPTDHPRPASPSFRGDSVPVHIPAGVVEGLRGVVAGEGATLFMGLLAAWVVLLARLSGSVDVVVGSPVAGRGRPELEGLIGFFVNTLVLRVDVSGDPEFREVVRRVREVTLDGLAHQEVPFERLVAELAPVRDLSRTPLFQVMFALQNAPGDDLDLDGVSTEPVAVPSMTAKFDLTLELYETGDGIEGRLEYATDLFDRGSVVGLVERFVGVVGGVAVDGGVRVGDVGVLLAGEGGVVVPAVPVLRLGGFGVWGGSVGELVVGRAAGWGDAVAVVDGVSGVGLSYGELVVGAEGVAAELRGVGVGVEDRVGVCLGRGVGWVVSLLGVWLAGAAYVPVDPGWPRVRREWVLADAGAGAVISAGGVEVVEGRGCRGLVGWWTGSVWRM